MLSLSPPSEVEDDAAAQQSSCRRILQGILSLRLRAELQKERQTRWTHNPYCERSWSGWDFDLVLSLNARLHKTCIDILTFLSHTLPPCVLIEWFTLSWVGSEWDLKMEASWKWVSYQKLENWEIVQVFNSAKKKCFHHFAEAGGIYQVAWYWIYIVLAFTGTNCIHFTSHITCDRFKRLKWTPPKTLVIMW